MILINGQISTGSTIRAVVKAIDRTIGKVHVTPPGGVADNTPSQRGSLDCARCSTRLMSRSRVSLNVFRRAVVIDVGRAVIVFVALGVSASSFPWNLLLMLFSRSWNL